MRLVLLGPPGCGKGTQAAVLRDRFGIPHLSTGAMLRSAVEADTEIGRRAASIMSRGALVPDEVVQKIVALRLGLEDCARGYILDGFPRTVAQADALEQMLDRADHALDQVIEFTISEDELVRRITGRYVCTKCDAVYNEHSKPTQRKNICDVCGGTAFRRREDDRAETVAERMAAYRAETAPLVPYYGSRGLLTQIDGTQSTVKVTDALLGALS
ncbi:MAG: adenylate kinase [Rhodospirillales bacterium]|nr:adenylate kinase [Rhodospirillales bacterium]